MPYKGITFTMPNVLWPLFRDRQLARLLPVLAAKTIEDPSYSTLILRITYDTREGERKQSETINLYLVP